MATTACFDLAYAAAPPVWFPASGGVSLVLVGCGGTGSWLAPHVARIARLLRDQRPRFEVRVTFVDPDQVEPKNTIRQNFSPAECGRNKAVALAVRLSAAFGLPIAAQPAAFAPPKTASGLLPVLIGCVDGPEGRRSLLAAVQRDNPSWWLDCGNEKNSGQVLLGGGWRDGQRLPGLVTWLPLPAEVHPDLLEDPAQAQKPLSCAELNAQEGQGLAINARMAAEAADYLVRLLLTGDLRKRATYIDLESGTARSVYCAQS